MQHFRLVIFVALLILSSAIHAQAENNAERITSFVSYVKILPNAALHVHENINVFSRQQTIKHGIVREFPTIYRNAKGQSVHVDFKLIKVELDGSNAPYHVENARNGLRIFIGSKDVIIPAGLHSFVIDYQVDKELGFFINHDELYWNVTGNGWRLPIDSAKVIVEVPPGATIGDYTAYTGFLGAREQNYQATLSPNKNSIEISTTQPLQEGQGLTIVVGWPKGFVHPPSVAQQLLNNFSDNFILMVALSLFILLLFYYFLMWFWFGKEPRRGTVFPQYEAPLGFSPASVRYLSQMKMDEKTFITSLLSLGVKGAIKIEERDDKYILSKTQRQHNVLSKEETDVLNRLFWSSSKPFILSKVANEFYSPELLLETMSSEGKILHTQFYKKYFQMNYLHLLPGILVSLILLFLLFKTFNFAMLFPLLFGVGIPAITFNVNSALANSTFLGRKILKAGISILVLFFLAYYFEVFDSQLKVIVFIVALGFTTLNFIFFYLMKVHTPQGRQIMDKIEGLKLYLSTAEKYTTQNWKPPEKTPEIFERLFPFAVALDLENQWVSYFSDIIAREKENPDSQFFNWYSGSNRFNPSNLGSGFSSRFASAIAASSNPPGTSSGFGGGGSSGGGGGGGGGGGW